LIARGTLLFEIKIYIVYLVLKKKKRLIPGPPRGQ